MGHADTRMVETVYARSREEGILGQLDFLNQLNESCAIDITPDTKAAFKPSQIKAFKILRLTRFLTFA
ncbi:MAG: hypothetical protein IKL25_06850 [Clostridia bacterium]|nr:hypothetical protein [Clostridia bacterium]